MALAPDDVPAGYFDDYSEWWVPADAFSALTLGGMATPPGLARVYQTFYFNPDEVAGIHTYLYEFASPKRPRPESQSSTKRCGPRCRREQSSVRPTCLGPISAKIRAR